VASQASQLPLLIQQLSCSWWRQVWLLHQTSFPTNASQDSLRWSNRKETTKSISKSYFSPSFPMNIDIICWYTNHFQRYPF
jgi:hypothetical protein